ncbi:MAG: hypothetical protein ABIR33_06240 [Pyrinomonadaceae bacterium]
MKRKLLILALMAVFAFVALPTFSSEVSAQRSTRGRDRDYNSYRGDRRWSKRGKKKSHWGYKNYGQYRRTQVGNRRYRMERRYYYRDGNRFSRLVRVFF